MEGREGREGRGSVEVGGLLFGEGEKETEEGREERLTKNLVGGSFLYR